jgi:hypothetical protein
MGKLERGLLWGLVLYAALDRVPAARAGGDPRSYAASEFALVSDQGKLVGAFRLTPEGQPEFFMNNARGRGRIVMRVKADGEAVLGIADEHGILRSGVLGAATGEYHTFLTDAAGTERISLQLDSTGRPRFSMFSAKGTELVGLGEADAMMPFFSLASEGGDIRLLFGNEAGAMGLRLVDKNGTSRAGIELDSASVARVFVADSVRKGGADLSAGDNLPPALMLRDKNGRKVPVK